MGKPIASVAGGRQSVLLGLGVHRPERVVTNDEICELIDSTDEWIQTRSGIKSRRFSGEGEGILAMSISAVSVAARGWTSVTIAGTSGLFAYRDSTLPTLRGAHTATHSELAAPMARTAPMMMDHTSPMLISQAPTAARTIAKITAEICRRRTSASVSLTDLA